MYPTFIQLWSAMIQWYFIFFFGMGNVMLEGFIKALLREIQG